MPHYNAPFGGHLLRTKNMNRTDGRNESVLVDIGKDEWVTGTVEEVTEDLVSLKTYTTYWVRLNDNLKTLVKVEDIDKIQVIEDFFNNGEHIE